MHKLYNNNLSEGAGLQTTVVLQLVQINSAVTNFILPYSGWQSLHNLCACLRQLDGFLDDR